MRKNLKIYVHFLNMIFIGASLVSAQEPNRDEFDKSSLVSHVTGFGQGSAPFPDFGHMVEPRKYHDGRVFRLSQSYPRLEPEIEPAVQKILSIDFKQDWKQYALAVREYILEGNTNNANYGNHFYLENNKVRDWYHVPWQHWGKTGREGIHGLTKEGPIEEHMLAPQQVTESHAYAVGFYNSLGGYTIGQVWKNPNFPNINYMNNHQFPEGTIVGKVLFVPLDEKEVPYLENPVEWYAYICSDDLPTVAAQGRSTGRCGTRQVATVRLIQMDFMVRDNRSKETGWTFGTFVYNGKVGHANRWKNLVPLGLMWGNDPDVRIGYLNPKPTETKINPKLTQTYINDDRRIPASHLGWGGRLNGPVDNAHSSCVSCHSTAQYPVVSSILPMFNNPKVPAPEDGKPAGREWMRWFRNIWPGEPFDDGQAVPMDYSLQLTKSIQNFMDAKSRNESALYAAEYWSKGNKVRRNINER